MASDGRRDVWRPIKFIEEIFESSRQPSPAHRVLARRGISNHVIIFRTLSTKQNFASLVLRTLHVSFSETQRKSFLVSAAASEHCSVRQHPCCAGFNCLTTLVNLTLLLHIFSTESHVGCKQCNVAEEICPSLANICHFYSPHFEFHWGNE